jgi:hypothetical protein
MAKWLAFLICIHEIPGLDLGPEAGYPDLEFS